MAMENRRRRRSIFDIISEHAEELESWAERMEDFLIEQPSWNCQACTIEPLCNVTVDAKEVVVTADLPFTKADTIKVEPINDDALDITAKMKRTVCFDDFGIRHRRGEFSMFRCEVHIPVSVKMESLQTTFKKGILEARLQRKHAPKTKAE